MMNIIKKAKKEILFVGGLFVLFCLALCYNEKTAVSSAAMCFFSILAKDKFSKTA
ncbi:hypothetical protein [Bacillus sp. AFS098217]|uniref:hypothetical protein n=1 Tax=Bacillus sp. AFS098217 TaxID=2033868 RepID=UPI0015CF75EA|nr:hypothetical protein [Bacillus sp. AFS098217]